VATITPAELARMERELELLNKQKELTNDLTDSQELARLGMEKTVALQRASVAAQEERLNKLKDERTLLEGHMASETDRYLLQQQRKLLQESTLEIAETEVRLLEAKLKETGKLDEADLARLKTAKATLEVEKQRNKALEDAVELGTAMGQKMALYGQDTIVNVGNLKKLASGLRAPVQFLDSLSTGLFVGIIDTIINLGFAVDEMESSFRQATGASEKFTRNLTQTWDMTRQYGVTAEEAGAANAALFNTFTDFTLQTPAVQREVSRTTQILGEFGVSVGDVAKGIQVSTKAFGQTAEGAAKTALEINALAQDLGVAPQKLAADFASVGGQLAKMGDNGTRAFKDLAMRAKATGLEIGKLLQMTEKFDTFEGAATQAGKLNAALGGNFVNAMDLMTETDPAARFDMIRDAITDAGLSFDDMSYYQRKYYAEAAGLDNVNDLAMMLSGNYDNLAGGIGQTSAEIADQQKKAADMKTAMEELKNALLPLIPIFTGLVDWISKMAKAIQNNMTWIKPLITTLGKLWAAIKIGKFLLGSYGAVVGFFGKAAAETAASSSTAGHSITRMGVGIGRGGKAAAKGMHGWLAFGLAVTLIGLGIAIAAAGLALLVLSFAGLGDAAWPAAAAIIGFTLAFAIMIAAMVWGAPGIATAGAGILWLAAAVGALGLALLVVGASWKLMSGLFGKGKDDTAKYGAMSEATDKMAQKKDAMNSIAESFEKIAEAMSRGAVSAGAWGLLFKSMSGVSLNLGSTSVTTGAVTTANAYVPGAMAIATNVGTAPLPPPVEPIEGETGGATLPTSPRGATTRTAAAAPARQPATTTTPQQTEVVQPRYTVPLTLMIDGDKFKEKVLTIVNGRLSEMALGN